jgi:uncharacterized phage infection (PIP) family protein YhgE
VTNNLVREIKQLRKVKPRKDWVLSTKTQILGKEQSFELFPFFRPAYAGLFVLLVLLGLFEFSQGALPGESLYYLKKITERGQIILSSEDEKPGINLEFANKRLEELNQIAQRNEVKKLAPAMEEFRANVSEAAKNLPKLKKIDENLVLQTKKLEENKEKIEKVLATKIEDGAYAEYISAMAQVVENQINDLEERTLTEEDEVLLREAKADFERGDYSDALVKILDLSQR